ncbi:low-affinity Fe(II) transport protein [Basidiobolus meristosporus CBS 931.73]|uniref:Low-affinity Fe(II) transport protein n=1 Tax=Basidiobolus meristosporus CBS 931.73 TaxID=1314790 RepID=A0A1Y1VS39_9FUNG|nr:low-affinity Fe(II) transport protein [Basidiobolus meristosporus CBS 931.73]|eukprot:ORX64098.1 low-affinity Fe(II) transport protein [Basidiobolus meristosporus CBS 931.73]
MTSYRSRFYTAISAPGRQHSVQASAPTQFVTSYDKEKVTIIGEELPRSLKLYSPEAKKSLGGRFFDTITQYAGSRMIFLVTLIILIVWAILGIVFGAPENWQIAMQDGSSIQCYISDTLLMRQQQNHCHRLLSVIAQLRSRNATFRRLLSGIPVCRNPVDLDKATQEPKDDVGDAVKLPVENWFDRCCNWVSMAVGSIYSLIIYWMGIFAWIGTGQVLGWSDLWQLYINTAVAVELTFTSMFLQNTRRRHMEYFEKCLKSIMKADCELEILLRQMTGDNESNPIIEIKPHKVSRGVRSIDYYADVIGSGIGAIISTAVFILWIAIGNYMQWDSNWWLIIGTYTGLVGFVDGFVLRNVYFRQDTILNEQFDVLVDSDLALFQTLGLPLPEEQLYCKKTLIYRVSHCMGVVCSMPGAVLASLMTIVALLCIASGMHWNQTGQLICNTPTMIIEGFLLIVLIQAHNMANTKRRVQLHDILTRRLKLLQHVRSVLGKEGSIHTSGKKNL